MRSHAGQSREELPFPYEELLAYHRGRIADEQTRGAIQRRLAEDHRWIAHYQSIRYLELERAAAQKAAAELPTFLDGSITPFCKYTAEEPEEFVSALQSQAVPQPLAEHSLGELQSHVDQCAYCGRVVRSIYADRERQAAGLPSHEPLLRDWLLQTYCTPWLERITQSLQLTAGLDVAVASASSAKPERNVSRLGSRLVNSLLTALTQPEEVRSKAIDNAIYGHDPLFAIAAGEEGEAVATSPVYFTALTAPPAQLSWHGDVGEGPWQVKLLRRTGHGIASDLVSSPRYLLTPEVQQSLPSKEDIRWQVEANGRVLTRGVFVLILPESRTDLPAELPSSESAVFEITSVLVHADKLRDQQLYGPAIELLNAAVAGTHGTKAFLLRRSLASIYSEIRVALTGERQMGTPEGTWARQLQLEHLAAAYQSIGIECRVSAE